MTHLNNRSHRSCSLSAALLFAGASGFAVAQTTPSSSTAQSSGETAGVLQEIVVTATRHEEALSKVPVSVSAYTQEDMDQKGIKDFTDVVRYVPGVSIDQTGTNSISIRGISSSGGADTTGIYIDDTPIQMRSLGFNPDDTLPKTFDLERVEVLRGPQGTLFGAGSEGGTVRYILNQPSVTTDSTYARAEVSDTQYGSPSYEAGVAHGGPLIDGVLGYRISAWYRHDGGWIDRIDPTTVSAADPTGGTVVDSNANREGDLLLRFALLWQPVAGLDISPSIYYQDRKVHDVSTYWPAYSNASSGKFENGDPDRIPIPDKFWLPVLKITANLGSTQLISNTSFYARDETTGYEGTSYNLSYYQEIGWAPAGYTTGWLDQTQYPLIDSNGVHLPAGQTNYRSPATVQNQQRSFTQEIRLQSNDPSSRWTWTTGLFFQLSRELSLEEIHDPNADAFLEALFGENVAQIFSVPLLPNGDDYYNWNVAHDRQYAAFGEVTYGFTDQWKLTLGARVARTSFNIDHFTDGPEYFGSSGLLSADQSATPFTPKASVAYQATPSDLYYFTYAKGFRVGGANPPLPYAFCAAPLQAEGYASGQAPETYKPDTTQSFEVGSKNLIADHVRVAASVYYIRWNDIQQNVYVPGSCGLQFTDNLGTAVAKGFDLQADFAFGPVTIETAIGYTDARFIENSKNDLAADGDAISGQAAINGSPGTSPPWNVTIGPQFNFHIADHKSFVRFDYEFESRNPWLAPIQDPRSPQYSPYPTATSVPGYQISPTLPSTSFVQFRTGMEFGRWRPSFFIDNLLNSHTTTNYERTFIDTFNPTYTGTAGYPPVPLPQYNNYTFRPRTFGITVTYN